MRLIDADELKEDDEVTLWISNDAVRTGKMLKKFSELFVKKIDEQPTIQAVPIDVLDKIRDAIEREADYQDAYVNADVAKGLYMAIEIIDKQAK